MKGNFAISRKNEMLLDRRTREILQMNERMGSAAAKRRMKDKGKMTKAFWIDLYM